jgi:hypothetical protein
VTSTDDYPGEMPAILRIDDLTAEELLAGRPVAPELESLATMLRALQEVAEQPAPPSAELAARMAAGDFPLVATGTQHSAAGRFERLAVRQRLRRVFGTGDNTVVRVVGRLAAAGVAVSVLGVGTAGFAGSLPSPVQNRFEHVVESVTPYRFEPPAGGYRDEPRPSGPTTPAGIPGELPGGAVPGDGQPGDAGVGDDAGGIDPGEVGEDARDFGIPDGRQPGPGQQPGPPVGPGDEQPGPPGPPREPDPPAGPGEPGGPGGGAPGPPDDLPGPP